MWAVGGATLGCRVKDWDAGRDRCGGAVGSQGLRDAGRGGMGKRGRRGRRRSKRSERWWEA